MFLTQGGTRNPSKQLKYTSAPSIPLLCSMDYHYALTERGRETRPRERGGRRRTFLAQNSTFENRDHVISILSLDRDAVLRLPTDGAELVGDEVDDPLACSVCKSEEASAANPIVKCDGEHAAEVGTHLACMDPLLDGGVPEDAWFCVECQQNSVYQVKAVVGKSAKMKRLVNGQRTGRACVHYKIEWAGQQWVGHDTWEPLESLQAPIVKAMISAFNMRARRA